MSTLGDVSDGETQKPSFVSDAGSIAQGVARLSRMVSSHECIGTARTHGGGISRGESKDAGLHRNQGASGLVFATSDRWCAGVASLGALRSWAPTQPNLGWGRVACSVLRPYHLIQEVV